jgi:hypothetical protein
MLNPMSQQLQHPSPFRARTPDSAGVELRIDEMRGIGSVGPARLG